MLKVTLPWTNYNGPLGATVFENSVAYIEGDDRVSPLCVRLNSILPGIRYETVKDGDEPVSAPPPPAPKAKAAPKPMPKPLTLKKSIPVSKVEVEPENEDIVGSESEDRSTGSGNDEEEDPGDMMASDRLPPTTSTNPTPAEVAEAAKRLKKLGITGANVLGPRLPKAAIPAPAPKPKPKAKKGKGKK